MVPRYGVHVNCTVLNLPWNANQSLGTAEKSAHMNHPRVLARLAAYSVKQNQQRTVWVNMAACKQMCAPSLIAFFHSPLQAISIPVDFVPIYTHIHWAWAQSSRSLAFRYLLAMQTRLHSIDAHVRRLVWNWIMCRSVKYEAPLKRQSSSPCVMFPPHMYTRMHLLSHCRRSGAKKPIRSLLPILDLTDRTIYFCPKLTLKQIKRPLLWHRSTHLNENKEPLARINIPKIHLSPFTYVYTSACVEYNDIQTKSNECLTTSLAICAQT